MERSKKVSIVVEHHPEFYLKVGRNKFRVDSVDALVDEVAKQDEYETVGNSRYDEELLKYLEECKALARVTFHRQRGYDDGPGPEGSQYIKGKGWKEFEAVWTEAMNTAYDTGTAISLSLPEPLTASLTAEWVPPATPWRDAMLAAGDIRPPDKDESPGL